jgi:hypothetical protein
MDTLAPRTRTEIVSALDALAADGLGFWTDIDPDRFAARFGEAWSPAENIVHLVKATSPVAKAMSLPGPTLVTMFGAGRGESVSYRELRDRYLELLVGGVDAGKYAPDELQIPDDRVAWQQGLVASCRDAVRDLARVAERWEESDLDRYQIPHPLLGQLTVREMLLFTLYHHTHHKQNVARRMESS